MNTVYRVIFGVSAVGLGLMEAGCYGEGVTSPHDEESSEATSPSDPEGIGSSAEAVVAADESKGDGATFAPRYCNEAFQCNRACACISGTCQPDGFGPPASPAFCATPPQRACGGASNCRAGCACSGSICQPDGFGPPVSPDTCAQPPPDAYEDNDIHNRASNYMGSPQTGHNFHDRGDNDWILVYFGQAMTATFVTENLADGANTSVEVYAYDYNPYPAPYGSSQLGALVGANDDVCGYWYWPQCQASQVVVSVPANSIYAIRITNTNDGARKIYDQQAPSYDFRIY